MCSFLPGVGTVDCNRSLNKAILNRQPETVTFAVISFAEPGKITRHLNLKGEAKSDEFAVVARMKLDNSSDGTWCVVSVNCQGHDGILVKDL